MQIFVKTLNGKTLSFDVKGSMLIEELKYKIQEKVGIFPYNQLLNFSGKTLRDDKKIKDYKINKESTIHLSLNLRGGLILTALVVGAGVAAIYGAAKNESTTKNTVVTEAINDFTQEIRTELKNSNRATSTASQKLAVNIDYGRMLRCKLTVDQDQEVELRATMDAMTELDDTQTAELVTLITNAQQTAIEQANAALNVPGTENESDLDNEVRNKVENNLTMSINKTFENMNYTKSDAVQEAYIDLWGLACKDSSILIDQNQVIKVFSENLSETISDTIQSGEITTDIHNEQSQDVKQKNEGFGASGSASLMSLFILSGIITVITAVISKVGGGDGEDPWAGTKYEKIGGAKKGGYRWNLIIGMLVVSLLIIGIMKYFIEKYRPIHECPSEETCSKAWDEVRQKGPRARADYYQKYHNCRLRHRIEDTEKPAKFRPHCESYCSHAKREAETPGYGKNPLEWYWCFSGLRSRENREDPGTREYGVDDESTADEGNNGEGFKNIPEGYSNYQ
jgi:hypothetical protein